MVNIKTSQALLSLIYSVSLILAFCILFVLIIMLIGNYTIIGTKYYQLNNKLDQMIVRNVTVISDKITNNSEPSSTNRITEKVYLYGHPWLMVILIIMTCITATSYVIKGMIYILNQQHENILKKKITECLENSVK